MKKFLKGFIVSLLAGAAFVLVSCGGKGGGGEEIPVVPGTPGDLEYTADYKTVTVTWTAGNNAESYELQLGNQTESTSKLSHTFENLSYDKKYTCKVRSVKADEKSEWAEVEFTLSFPPDAWLGKWNTENIGATFKAGTFTIPLDSFLPTPGEGLPPVRVTFSASETPGKVQLSIADLDSVLPLPEDMLSGVPMNINEKGVSASLKIDESININLPEPLKISSIPGITDVIEGALEGIPLLGPLLGSLLADAELRGIELTVNSFNVSGAKKSAAEDEASLKLVGSGKLRLNTSLDDTDIPLIGNVGDLLNGIIGTLSFEATMDLSKTDD